MRKQISYTNKNKEKPNLNVTQNKSKVEKTKNIFSLFYRRHFAVFLMTLKPDQAS